MRRRRARDGTSVRLLSDSRKYYMIEEKETMAVMEKDMTKGSPFRLILAFTIPLIIGNVFQQLYNMVDAIIVGRTVGVNALAAVGMSGSIVFLILGFLNGLTTGFTVLTSRTFGAGNMDGMKKSVYSSSVLAVVVTVILTVISVAGLKGLLRLMNTPDEIFQDAYQYLFVVFLGIWTQVLYNLLASFLRALGNSKIPLYFLILAAVLNIFLDLFFILVLRMGTKGAAVATVISQGVSGILCLVYIVKKVPLLHMKKEHRVLEKNSVRFQIKVGIPMGLQFSITALGIMILQSALNGFGARAVAGFTASTKVMQLINQAMISIGVTMATYSSQNIGAGRFDRIRKGARVSTGMSAVYALVITVVLHFWGKYMVRMFIDSGQTDVLQYCEMYFSIIAPFMLILGTIFIYRNILQGMGFGFVPMMAGAAELAARTAAAFTARHFGSFEGICWADPLAWVAAASPLVITYLWRMKKLEREAYERE